MSVRIDGKRYTIEKAVEFLRKEDGGKPIISRKVSSKPKLSSVRENINCLDPYYVPCPKNPFLCYHKNLEGDYAKKVCDSKISPETVNTVFMAKNARLKTHPYSRNTVEFESFPVAHSAQLDADSIPDQDVLDKGPIMSINNLRGLSGQQYVDLERKYGGLAEASIALGEGKEDIVALRMGADVPK